MNQKQYLRALNRSLYLYVPWEERQEILADYREYFADAIREDGSEAALMKRFGTPSAAARAILSERGIFLISRQVIFKVVSFVISLILLGFAAWGAYSAIVCPGYSDFEYFLYDHYGVILFIIAGVNFFLRSLPLRAKPKRVNRWFWIVSGAVSLAVLLTVVLSLTLWFIPVLKQTLAGIYIDDADTVGPRMGTIFVSLTSVLFVVWLWLLAGPRNHTMMSQSLNFWFAGLVGMFMSGHWIASSLSDPAYLFTVNIWIEWLWPFALGIVLTGAAILASYLLQKKRR